MRSRLRALVLAASLAGPATARAELWLQEIPPDYTVKEVLNAGAAEKAIAWIDGLATGELAHAASHAEAGRSFAAACVYEAAVADFAGMPAATQAASALTELLSDPARKRQVDAGRALDKAMDRARDVTVDQAIGVFESFVKRWDGADATTLAHLVLAGLHGYNAHLKIKELEEALGGLR